MPGPVIADPTPDWLKPENASVTDTALTKAMRMIGHLIGADNPTAQVLGLMMTDVPGGSATGGLAKAVEGLKARVIKAYHGSPHDFERFSLEKIGTGEGAQAYGHGLYFAEKPETAQAYRETLSKFGHASEMPDDMTTSILLDNRVVNGRTPSNKLTPLERAALTKHYAGNNQQRAIQETEYSLKYMTPDTEAYRGELETLNVLKTTDLTGRVKPFTGRTYEVAIHADPEDFLDWDKPLSQQSEKVKQALGPDLQRDEFVSAAGKRLVDYSGDTLLGIKLQSELRANGGNIQQALESLSKVGNESWKAKVEAAKGLDWSGLAVRQVEAPGTGQNLINDLQRKHTPEGVNTYLKSKGIPGIKYLDQGSRSAGEGSRNYVVFDDRLIDILKKYGLLLPATGAAGEMTIGRRSTP